MSKKLLILSLLFINTTYATLVELNTKNIVFIKGTITSTSMNDAKKDLLNQHINRDVEKYPIYIVLDSPGGNIMAGNNFINFANTIPNIKTICLYCASMAHAISQGIVGERLATRDNIMMSHRASGGFQGQFEDGELESRLKLFKTLVRSMEQRNADRIGITLKNYKKKVRNEWYTYGKDSKIQNIVDKLINIKCSKDLMLKKKKSIKMTLFGPVEGPEESICPLL